MKLSRKQIIKIQKNRDPYLLIDYATKVVPGKSVEGYKILKKNEWFFKVHWPGDPNMPGMLQVEAMVQMSSLIIFTSLCQWAQIIAFPSTSSKTFINSSRRLCLMS